MHPIIAKTFGGLSRAYYIRQMLFGLLFPAFFIFMFSQQSGPSQLTTFMIVFLIVNTLLYPYSRFVYESIVGYIMGNNLFFTNVMLLFFAKAITMMICWTMAILIAPFGLLYLYFHHSKKAAPSVNEPIEPR
jgi:predicted membrane protein